MTLLVAGRLPPRARGHASIRCGHCQVCGLAAAGFAHAAFPGGEGGRKPCWRNNEPMLWSQLRPLGTWLHLPHLRGVDSFQHLVFGTVGGKTLRSTFFPSRMMARVIKVCSSLKNTPTLIPFFFFFFSVRKYYQPQMRDLPAPGSAAGPEPAPFR